MSSDRTLVRAALMRYDSQDRWIEKLEGEAKSASFERAKYLDDQIDDLNKQQCQAARELVRALRQLAGM